ncbi:hypothetical protein Taro_026763 [Colocasia esculenta]|uniref:Uncharacterized protein n=1 Tax=Colocasia esculenta TaxID=4460 RepID=A0A843V700_COLES|nr:hypothetical protein [Colocasia esculenta]
MLLEATSYGFYNMCNWILRDKLVIKISILVICDGLAPARLAGTGLAAAGEAPLPGIHLLGSLVSLLVSYALASSLRPKKVGLFVKEPAFTDAGEPVVFFTEDDISRSEEPLSFAIIAKCSYGRLAIAEIKSCLTQRLALQRSVVISVLNPRHLLAAA